MSQTRVLTLIDNITQYIDSNGSTKSKQSALILPLGFGGGVEIPSAATVTETIVLDHEVEKVWNALKDCTFDFCRDIKSSEQLQSSMCVGTLRKLTYNDGTTQTYKIDEISSINRRVTYSLIASEPRVNYSSVVHSIRLLQVTCPGRQTFVEWQSTFSNDASLQDIQDSRFKKKEAFKDLDSSLSSAK